MAGPSQFPAVEVQLVTRVKGLLQPTLDAFAPTSSIPVSFWGALTCGETGEWLIHNLIVPPRLEPTVFQHLMDVLTSTELDYGGLKRADLAGLAADEIRALASSHGLTQVMGYNAVVLGHQVAELDDPATHYPIAARLMAQFNERFGLDPAKDFAEMATCWNGGHVGAKTVPPEYAANLVLRKSIWEAL